MRSEASQIMAAARAKGFDPATLEKVLRLKELLGEFNRHPYLKARLVLKGGTAINLFLTALPRLSVDIDLNYVGQAEREGTLEERPLLEKAIRQVVEGLRYRVQEGSNEHALFGLYLNYRNHLDRDDRIEVETNFLMRVCALPPTTREALRVANESTCRFPTLALEELMAGKLKALIERGHPRDLYDVFTFQESKTSHDPLMLNRLTILFASTLEHDLRTYHPARYDRAFSEQSLERLLYPMLRSDDRPSRDDMLRVVKPLWQDVVRATGCEPFLDAMARGEYQPGLLFPKHPEIAARIANHPALVWKAQNTRAHLARISSSSKRP